MARALIQATAVAVAIDPDGPLCGALLVGPSGCGKSSLALALIETCAWRRTSLVGDDAVFVGVEDGRVFAERPDTIAGLIEVRGFGPLRVRSTPRAPLLAAFDLNGAPERLPTPQMRRFGEAELACRPFAAAPEGAARLKVILRAILAKEAQAPPAGAH